VQPTGARLARLSNDRIDGLVVEGQRLQVMLADPLVRPIETVRHIRILDRLMPALLR
jgi:hypothetical protein